MDIFSKNYKNLKIKSTEPNTSRNINAAVKFRVNDKSGSIESIEPVTINEFFKICCQRYSLRPALAIRDVPVHKYDFLPLKEKWKIISYTEFAEKVDFVAKLLISFGMKAHEAVAIFSNNCPEWFFLQFGIHKASGIVLGIQRNSSIEEIFYTLSVTAASVCVVGNSEEFKKVCSVCSRLPKLKTILQLHEKENEEFCMADKQYYCWNDMLKQKFNYAVIEELKQRECEQNPNECAMIVFTPGVVGKSKPVMLSHDNLIYNVKAVCNSQENFCWGVGRVVSYLPLSHICGQAFEVFAPILTGSCIYFADIDTRKATLVHILVEVKPTMFVGVPKVYEKLQNRLLLEKKRKGTLSSLIENTARDEVKFNSLCEANCTEISVSIKDTLANYIVNNMRRAVGMECCELFFCIGCPLSGTVMRFFANLDVKIFNVYCCAELSGPATINQSLVKLASYGKPIDGTKIKIVKKKVEHKKGEILFHGRHVFMGYLNQATETAATIDKDGWFHSGDYGYSDDEGYLFNGVQMEDFLAPSDGETKAPKPIEEALKEELPALSNAMVIGYDRDYLTALLTLKTKTKQTDKLPTDSLHDDTREWLKSLGFRFRKLSDVLKVLSQDRGSEPAFVIIKSIFSAIEGVNNRGLCKGQRIRRILLLRNDFSIATGELGSSLEIKRDVVLEKYANKINDIYS